MKVTTFGNFAAGGDNLLRASSNVHKPNRNNLGIHSTMFQSLYKYLVIQMKRRGIIGIMGP